MRKFDSAVDKCVFGIWIVAENLDDHATYRSLVLRKGKLC